MCAKRSQEMCAMVESQESTEYREDDLYNYFRNYIPTRFLQFVIEIVMTSLDSTDLDVIVM